MYEIIEYLLLMNAVCIKWETEFEETGLLLGINKAWFKYLYASL